ncbi:putative transcription factor interactor and regulator CCHC(Zn) family [Helianthus anomalus]
MPELSSSGGLIPPSTPLIPPDRPPDEANPSHVAISSSYDIANRHLAQPPPFSTEIRSAASLPNPPNIVICSQIGNESGLNLDVQPPLSANSSQLEPQQTLIPKASSPKNKAKAKKGRGANLSSGDPDLDAVRAAAIAHDAAIQQEFDSARGIKRFTRSRSNQSGVQIAGFGAVRKQKKAVKYSPMLTDLRVKDFVDNTPQATIAISKQNPDEELLGKSSQTVETQYGSVSGGCQVGRADATAGISVPISANNLQQDDVEVVSIHSVESDEDDSCREPMNEGESAGADQQGSMEAVNVEAVPAVVKVPSTGLNTADQQPRVVSTSAIQQPPLGGSKERSVWDRLANGPLSYGQLMQRNKEENAVKMIYYPPTITNEGTTRIIISQEDLLASAQVYPLHLYGYFLGTSMDFRMVDRCFRRLWRAYDIDEITKSPAGIFYFKFKSEKGLNEVLENGPWMVNNIPVFLDKWTPGLSLEKVEPAIVPLWVTIHNIPLDLWTTTGINKLMSGMGEPKLMDKLTFERCKNQTGKLGYARVLVDVKASSNLPTEVEVVYPHRTTKLQVSYQWKPPICSHCTVFGHTLKQCQKVPKPIVDDVMHEDSGNASGESEKPSSPRSAPNVNNGKAKGKMVDNEGYETVVTKKKYSQKLNHPNGVAYASCSNPSQSGKQQGSNIAQKRVSNNAANDPLKLPGFNFSRAVQGPKKAQKPCQARATNSQTSSPAKKAPITKQTSSNAAAKNQVATQNRFAVLDLQASALSGQLIEEPADLYPQNPFNEETLSCSTNQQPPFDPGRVLPKWSTFNPADSLNRIIDFDYGITDGQKQRILTCLLSESRAVKAVDQENWSQGEHDFFWDKCTELGLDPDYCVEDVEEDDSGTAQFINHLSKTGKYIDPVVCKPPKIKK